MSATADVICLTGLELAAAYRDRSLSPREATAAFLDRIHSVDGSINAFCLVDDNRTLEQAAASEHRYAAGEPLGPLDGVPVAIKDLMLTEGWPTLRGSRAIASDQPWLRDAPLVERLRQQGVVFAGKTTTPELGWKGVTDSPLTGVSRNPWDPALTPGGSSGGSAAAVAAGMVPLALGTDGGGSIRIPAAFCGVVGHKPSFGRVPQWPSSAFGVLSHAGPIAWTVGDCALLLAAIAGQHPDDPTTLQSPAADWLSDPQESLHSLRIAFSRNFGYVDVHPEVERVVAAAADVLRALGAKVDERDPGFHDPVEAFEVLWYAGAAKSLEAFASASRADMDPGLVEIAEQGAGYSAVDYLTAMEAQSKLTQHMEHFFEEYDLLLSPTLPIPAFDAGLEVPRGWPRRRWMSWTPFTYPFNMTGSPAVSVPCGFDAQGLPVGLQLVGPRFADDLVLAVAAAYQQAASLTTIRPTLSL